VLWRNKIGLPCCFYYYQVPIKIQNIVKPTFEVVHRCAVLQTLADMFWVQPFFEGGNSEGAMPMDGSTGPITGELHHADLEKIAMQPCINQRSDMPSFWYLTHSFFVKMFIAP
jgi:hypothetical protein